MKYPLQAVILIEGMDPHPEQLAQHSPDPFLDICGRPALEHVLLNLRRFGFQDFLLLTDRHLEACLERYSPGAAFTRELEATIAVIPVPFPGGSAGALKEVGNRLHDTFLCLYSDSFFDFNYLDLSHCERDAEAPDWLARIALASSPDASREGMVVLDGCRVTALDRPVTGPLGGPVNSRVYWLNSRILEFVEDSCCSLERHILPQLIAGGRVIGRQYDGLYLNLGYAEDLVIANEKLRNILTRPAVFLDRDGTLNDDKGYVYKIEDFHWLAGARAAIRKLNDAGYLVFMVSNQSGIARGFYDAAAVDRLHQWMQDDLADAGAHFDDVRYCPHHPEGVVRDLAIRCDCRKPEPGMLRSLIKQWQPDLDHSFMLGDAQRDVQAGYAAGATGKKIHPGSILQAVESIIHDRYKEA